MAAENVVDCVLPCEKKSDETVCDGNKPVRHVCAKTTQGDKQLHLFKFSDAPCASACSDGKCVDKVDYEEGAVMILSPLAMGKSVTIASVGRLRSARVRDRSCVRFA